MGLLAEKYLKKMQEYGEPIKQTTTTEMSGEPLDIMSLIMAMLMSSGLFKKPGTTPTTAPQGTVAPSPGGGFVGQNTESLGMTPTGANLGPLLQALGVGSSGSPSMGNLGAGAGSSGPMSNLTPEMLLKILSLFGGKGTSFLGG